MPVAGMVMPSSDFAAKRFGWRSAFAFERHQVGLALAGDDQTQPSEFRMTLADLGDLLGPHEHALDLGGLVGAPHPALDAHVGAAAGAGAGQGGGEVAEREPDHGGRGLRSRCETDSIILRPVEIQKWKLLQTE